MRTDIHTPEDAGPTRLSPFKFPSGVTRPILWHTAGVFARLGFIKWGGGVTLDSARKLLCNGGGKPHFTWFSRHPPHFIKEWSLVYHGFMDVTHPSILQYMEEWSRVIRTGLKPTVCS